MSDGEQPIANFAQYCPTFLTNQAMAYGGELPLGLSSGQSRSQSLGYYYAGIHYEEECCRHPFFTAHAAAGGECDEWEGKAQAKRCDPFETITVAYPPHRSCRLKR